MHSKEDSTRNVIQCLSRSIFDRLKVFWENDRSAHDQKPFRCRQLYIHPVYRPISFPLKASNIFELNNEQIELSLFGHSLLDSYIQSSVFVCSRHN